jgi:hypothetical protein
MRPDDRSAACGQLDSPIEKPKRKKYPFFSRYPNKNTFYWVILTMSLVERKGSVSCPWLRLLANVLRDTSDHLLTFFLVGDFAKVIL